MRKLTKFKASGGFNKVDHDQGIIHGVSLLESGREASGHGLYIDMKMVRQATKQGKEAGELGLKARMDHPSACFSSMGSQLGRLKNFKTVGTKAVADLHIGEFAKHSPTGDMRKWLLSVAENDPSQVGFSVSFMGAEPEEFAAGEDDDPDSPEFMYPHARIDTLFGADVVDEGAATDSLFEEGILGRPDYLAEQAVHFVTEKEDLFRTALEPLVKKIINENTNQKSITMSDNKKSLKEDVKDLLKRHFSSEEVVEIPDTPEVNEEADVANVALTAKEAELTALTADMDAQKVDFDTKQAEAELVLTDLNATIEGLKTELEALKATPIGDTVEPVTNTGDVVEPSPEAKAAQKEIDKDDEQARWASEGL